MTEQDYNQSSRKITWFPGHMTKAIKEVKGRLNQVDLVIEVRDARLPFTSDNRDLRNIIQTKKHLIVCNKSNLADPVVTDHWKKWFAEQKQEVMFINALDSQSIKPILNKSKVLVKDKLEKFRKKGITPPPIRMMIIGIPNTGKSTLINKLTKTSKAKTGERPGVTQRQDWISLGNDFELLDTPGIMPPHIETEEQGLSLSCIHAIKDEIAGLPRIAPFFLNYMIKEYPSCLTEKYNLSEDIVLEAESMVEKIAVSYQMLKKEGVIDEMKVYRQVMNDFRKGRLGRISLERPAD